VVRRGAERRADGKRRRENGEGRVAYLAAWLGGCGQGDTGKGGGEKAGKTVRGSKRSQTKQGS
jgi:hypothetical protein